MRTFLGVTISAMIALGVIWFLTRGGGDYEKACTHMIDLANKELDTMLAGMPDDVGEGIRDLKEQAAKKRDSDMETCVDKMKEHKIDTKCILKANTLDETQQCLVRRR